VEPVAQNLTIPRAIRVGSDDRAWPITSCPPSVTSLGAVDCEWKLLAMTHNILKMWRMAAAIG
jgi:hypothetical protein